MTEVNICGLVVGGGTSQRMGNENKLWLKLGSEALIHRAVRRLRMQVDHVIVNTNEKRGLEQYTIVSDNIATSLGQGKLQSQQGPLAGILSGLEYIQAHHRDKTHIAIVPADAPFSPTDLVQKMRYLVTNSEIVVPFVGGYTQQLFALWPVSCTAALREFMTNHESRKVMNFIRSQDWQKLELSDRYDEQFINVNTPQDWVRAQDVFESGRYE